MSFLQFIEDLRARRPEIFRKKGPLTPAMVEEICFEAFDAGMEAAVGFECKITQVSPLDEHSPHHD